MRNLTSKALWIFFGDGGAKLFGFLTTIYLARTLGATQYGLITIAISILGITAWFCDLGIKTLATRAIAGTEPEQRDPSRFFWLKITLSFTVIVLAGGIVWFLMQDQPQLRFLILLFILSLLPQSLNIDWYFKGVQKFQWVTLASWTQGALYLTGLILIVSSDDLLTVPVIYSLSILAGALVTILSYRGKKSLFKMPDFTLWKSDIQSGFYLGIGHFFAQSIILIPPLVIGYFFTELQVGYYGVALKLILAAMLADHVINTLLLPNLTHLWQNERENVQPQLTAISRWVLFIGASAALFLAHSSGWLINLLFGDEYLPAVPLLMILSVILPVTFLNSVYTFGLISFGKDRDFLISTGIGALGAVVLMIASGFTGKIELVIVSVVLAEIWITLNMFLRFRKTVKLQLGRYLIGITLLFTILLASGLYVQGGLVAAVISPLILGLLLYIFRLIRVDDLNWLKRRLTR